MSFQRDVSRETTAGVGIAATAQDLAVIQTPGCAAAIWHRDLPAALRDFLQDLAPEAFPRGRVILRAEAIRQAMTELCEINGTPGGAGRAMLVDDVVMLAEMFSDLMNARYLRLRLEAVTTNACRKFHIDAVSARLICTYHGTGTQYGIATEDGDPAQVSTVPAGMPMILRGTLWPTDPPVGLRHRSPPIEGTGETRFVLVLDPVADPEDAV